MHPVRSPRALCLLAGLLLWVLPAHAQLTQSMRHFDEGNRRYAEGDYRGALAAYEQAVGGGYVSGALYYNMGNAYYRIDALGQAVRYYEKARRLLPDDVRLRHNLQIVQARRVDQLSEIPEPFWHVWWRTLVAAAGVYGLLVAGLVLYLGAALLLMHRIWTGARGPWHRRAMRTSAAAGLLLLVLAFTASVERQTDRRGVIVAAETTLRAAPRPDAEDTMRIHEGLPVDVLRDGATWLQVRLPNGTTGWVETRTVAEI